MSITYAVARGTAVGSTFPGLLPCGGAGHPPPSGVRTGNAWSCASSPRFFVVCCLINQCCVACLSTGTTLAVPFTFYGIDLNLLKCSLEYYFILYTSRRGAGNFSPHHRVQTGSDAHPAFYPMGTGGSFPGGKAAWAWSWPLTLSGNENAWSYISTPQYVFMAWCLIKQRDLTSSMTIFMGRLP
jgi:hypothetical protein